MKELIKGLLGRLGIRITKWQPNPRERVISLYPDGPIRGTALLSWLIDPFLSKTGEPTNNSHTQYQDCMEIGRLFLDLGFAIDVIDSHNQVFQPTKSYDLFVGHRINFDWIARLLHKGCVKIAHLDTAHWVFNNHATYSRQFDLQQRKGITIKGSDRIVEQNLAIDYADYAVTYGNQFTLNTYRYANRPLFHVPISTCAQFPSPESKDYEASRSRFLWYGSHGFVHKGLDLVLEAFAEMTEYELYVVGPLHKEKDFVKVFERELYYTSNIHAVGWVDVNGSGFLEIANKCVGVVYPSCAEGQAGSVTTCMHAGLIPIISYESGVDVEDFGFVLDDNSIARIKNKVQKVANLPVSQLQRMAQKAWARARTFHTREKFSEEYRNIILHIMGKSERKELEQPPRGRSLSLSR